FQTKKGIAVRVIADGGLGFGATNQMTKTNLRSITRKAVAAAKASSRLRNKPIAMAPAELGHANVEVRPRVNSDNIGLEDRTAFMKEIDDAAVASADRGGTRLVGRFISMDTWMTEKMIVTSDGAKVNMRTPRVALDLFLTVFDPQKGTAQRIVNLGESSGWEGIERWDVPSRAAKEVDALSLTLLKAESMKDETCDVVLGAEVVGIVSHESSGHPAEADRMLGREAAQAGETYLQRESISTKIGSDVVNVVEDPTLPRSFGFYLYDDEGVKAKKRYLIKEGRVSEFLHNRETASEFGVASNASSRAVSYDREPIVRMSNTFVEPGGLQFEELVEGVRFGVYIKNFMEWNIDDRRFNQRYVGLEAYRIEDGELRGRLRGPILELTTPALWSAVDAVGKELEFSAAYCGKGDPMQGIPVWTGGPPVRLRNIRLGGSA
ncbi:MAG: TldD/PmbA family protein, partial [Methanomassiliicoccales archaeon]